MESINIHEIVERLGSKEDGVRKKAAFGLQSRIGDPSFADVFIAEGGLTNLRHLVLHANGNTLAYSLTSLSRLLEVDKGWDYVNQKLVERVVELVVNHPLVNILRGAMSILVAIVSHSQPGSTLSSSTEPTAAQQQQPPAGPFGFRALKPAIAVYPEFLEMLVNRLSSADHALCANSLQLINSLMRDAITNDSDAEWPRFIRRLQDLGVIKAVYVLMQSSALQDLAHPLLEFQALTKVLLQKWRDVEVDQDKPEHRRTLKGLHLASNPEKHERVEDGGKKSRAHNPEKWRRLGFETESPALEFDEVGFLGMMDLTDFVRRHEDGYQKLLLEQATKPMEQRCPIARASLAVTSILYDHFEVDKSDTEDAKTYIALDSRTNFDDVFRPLLLQWSRLHTAGLQAVFRLWKSTGAEIDDFEKVEDLVRILIEQVVGQASRTKDVREVEEELAEMDLKGLRELQMQLLELTYEDAWGHHLGQVRQGLKHEALQFIREQRIRCLLRGSWFARSLEYKYEQQGPVTKQDLNRPSPSGWRYVRLSHNRRYLHYADFDTKGDNMPELDMLPEKVDLIHVSSVESNLTTRITNNNATTKLHPSSPSHSRHSSTSSLLSLHPTTPQTQSPALHLHLSLNLPTTLKITIHGPPPTASQQSHSSHSTALLTLFPCSPTQASEWHDGLQMLLLLPLLKHSNQAAAAAAATTTTTSETHKLIRLITDYGLKIRLLNVCFDDALYASETQQPEIPSRDGLDRDEFWYDVFGA